MESDSVMMDSSTKVTLTPVETASQNGDAVVESIIDYNALSTDSMTTIRLSNVPKPTENNLSRSHSGDIGSEQSPKTQSETETLYIQEKHQSLNRYKLQQDTESDNSQETLMKLPSRTSTASSSTSAHIERPTMGSDSGKAHPRANSFGSVSSTESTHVDWDELDKNEKQEQQDEGSDEVSLCYI